MALNMDLRPKFVSFKGGPNRGEEEGRGKERRRGRRREEEEKGSSSQDKKGMELQNLSMDLWFCMISSLSQT